MYVYARYRSIDNSRENADMHKGAASLLVTSNAAKI